MSGTPTGYRTDAFLGGRFWAMTLPRATLLQHLNALEARLPAMVRALSDEADQADVIVDAGGEADCEWVHERLDAMLAITRGLTDVLFRRRCGRPTTSSCACMARSWTSKSLCEPSLT